MLESDAHERNGDDGPDEEPAELPPPDEVVETRGPLTIVFWGAAGLIVGGMVGPAWLVYQTGIAWGLAGLGYGALVGAIIGLGVGACVWAFFPYKSK
jgi:hypothetical protein